MKTFWCKAANTRPTFCDRRAKSRVVYWPRTIVVRDRAPPRLLESRHRGLVAPKRNAKAYRSDLLDRFVRLLRGQSIRFCVVGGQAVNAYAEAVVSLDLDLVVVASDLQRLAPLLEKQFDIERFEHSLNVSDRGSDLRIQIQLDPRYAPFVERSAERDVLGERLAVAAIEDVLAGKVWAASDSQRRASRRQKDLADIARLPEVQPSLRERVPQTILDRLVRV